jgi:lipid-binding SYLF domain-containing protein
MRATGITAIVLGLAVTAQAADLSTKEASRVQEAATVLREIHGVPDRDIPQDLWEKAACVIVVPGLKKAALVVGGEYGKGVVSCRHGKDWSAPSFVQLEKGSIGFQLGGQATDFVLLVMNERGAKAILSSKVKLGADASAAAGPKGRSAEASTDVTMRAEILSYSRARGLFAGVSLSGSTVRPDNRANEKLYNKSVSASDIIFKGVVPVPTGAQKMIAYLNKKSPKNKSSGKEF